MILHGITGAFRWLTSIHVPDTESGTWTAGTTEPAPCCVCPVRRYRDAFAVCTPRTATPRDMARRVRPLARHREWPARPVVRGFRGEPSLSAIAPTQRPRFGESSIDLPARASPPKPLLAYAVPVHLSSRNHPVRPGGLRCWHTRSIFLAGE